LNSAREIVSAPAIKTMSGSVGVVSTGQATRLRECVQVDRRPTATDTSNPSRPLLLSIHVIIQEKFRSGCGFSISYVTMRVAAPSHGIQYELDDIGYCTLSVCTPDDGTDLPRNFSRSSASLFFRFGCDILSGYGILVKTA
jgi:hypothetical protein